MCSWAYEQKKDSLQGSLGGYPRQPRPLGVKRRALPLAGWARAADPRAAPRGHAAPHLPLSTSPSTRPPAPPPTCRVRVAALHKLELAGGVDDEVLGEAGQVHQVQRGGKQILGHKVAVRHCRGGGGDSWRCLRLGWAHVGSKPTLQTCTQCRTAPLHACTLHTEGVVITKSTADGTSPCPPTHPRPWSWGTRGPRSPAPETGSAGPRRRGCPPAHLQRRKGSATIRTRAPPTVVSGWPAALPVAGMLRCVHRSCLPGRQASRRRMAST